MGRAPVHCSDISTIHLPLFSLLSFIKSYSVTYDKILMSWVHFVVSRNVPCHIIWICRADSRHALSQWETSLQSNAPSHWLAANLASALDVQSWQWPTNTPCCRSNLHFNSLGPERGGSTFASVFFRLILQTDILSTSCEIGLSWVPQNRYVNIVSGNALAPSGNKVLPEPMLRFWHQTGNKP